MQRRLGRSRAASDLAVYRSEDPQHVRNFQARVRSINAVLSGNVDAAGAVDAAPAEAAPVVEEKKEKDAFDLKLKLVDAKAKIKVIKEVRVITGLGLKEV
jgi:large subunit ribosomal protein L7/L12